MVPPNQALRAVPPSIREGSLALGATKWQTVWFQVLPVAVPGILTGMILALSRAIGETAPLISIGALTHSVKVEASMADQFDCVYLAGGHGCCVDFVGEQGKELKALIEAAYAAGKIVAADCHGPMGLLEATVDGAPLVKGLEVTAFTNVEEDQAGATEWVKANTVFMEDEFQKLGAVFKKGDPWTAHVCKAGNLITAQNPQSADACAAAVIEALA